VGEGSRLPAEVGDSIGAGDSVGVGDGSSTVFRGSSKVRVETAEESGVSAGRTLRVAAGEVDKIGWQDARVTTRVNTSRGRVRSGMGQV
jgi:hypothetical protein